MNCCSYLTYTEVLFYPDPDFDFSFRLLTSVLASGGICLGRDWKLISVNDWGPGSACTSLCKWEWMLGHQLKTCSSWSHTGSGNLRESAKEYRGVEARNLQSTFPIFSHCFHVWLIYWPQTDKHHSRFYLGREFRRKKGGEHIIYFAGEDHGKDNKLLELVTSRWWQRLPWWLISTEKCWK